MKGRKVEIGRIDLLKNISFVEVAEEDADRVMKGLKGSRVKGREVVVDYADKNPSPRSPKKRAKVKDQFPTDFFDTPAKPEKKKSKARKPSREERGYTEPRGKKYKKEDWMKFLHPDK